MAPTVCFHFVEIDGMRFSSLHFVRFLYFLYCVGSLRISGCIRKVKGASSQVEEQITFAHAIWFEKKINIET